MTTATRLLPVTDGQLVVDGLRSRDLSGFPFSAVRDLAELMDDVGPPCRANSLTSGALHRLDGCVLRPPFHVLVPRGRNIQRVGHLVHTTTDLPLIDQANVGGIPTVSATRALIEIAGIVPRERLTLAVNSALGTGRTSDDFLHRRIAALRGSGRGGIRNLIAVLEGAELTLGAATWLEREVLRLLAAARLPRPLTQQVLSRRGDKLIRVDFRFPGTPVVVEALGYRWHRTAAQINIDTERLNRLILDGFVPLQFTYDRIVSDGEGAIGEVAEALHRFHVTT